MSHYKPYPAYRDSGVEWIGQVPEHWAVAPIKAVVQVVNGATPESGTASFWDGDIAWFTPADLDNQKATELTEPRRRITADGLASCAARLTPPGSVVLSTRAPVGSVGVTTVPSATNQGCRTLVPATAFPSKLLGETLVAARAELALRSNGTTFQELSTDALASMRIPVPPEAERGAIITALDRETARIDALIAKKTRFIELLKEKRQALITHAVTKGLDPKVKMKDSGVEWIGEVPEHWDVARVKHVSRKESGHTPDKKNPSFWEDCRIPWVSLKDSETLRNVDYIHDTDTCINELGLQGSSARILPKGTVVFTRDATVGLCAITQRPMAVSQHLIGWVPTGQVDPEYLLRVFEVMSVWLDSLTAGATIKTIGMDDIGSLATPFPPWSEQLQIAQHVRRVQASLARLIELTEQSITLLKERRSALITAAVTGQIDLRKAA